MRRSLLVGGIPLFLAGAVALAQGTGELPQQVRRNMEAAMRNLQNQGLASTQATFEESVGKERLERFLEGAVVKLTFHPDQSFTASSLEGGELVAFKLGKQTIELDGEGIHEEQWLSKSGRFKAPKYPQELSMTLRAGATEVAVDCHTRYRKSTEAVTFYVGPLDGLFCLGLSETSEM